MKKILLFGGGGMLGQELSRSFDRNVYDITSPVQSEVDITDQKAVSRAIHECNPDIVINAAVMVSVDRCESNPLAAYAVNTLGPLYIADALRARGETPSKDTIFIHYSSSDIFGGELRTANSEESANVSPVNVYSRSKYYAERCIDGMVNAKKFPLYIIRCSWIFSEFRETFVDTIAKQARNPVGIFEVANDQKGVPTSGKEIAENTQKLIAEQYPYGIYHFVGDTRGEEVTRWDVAREICDIVGQERADRIFRPAPRKSIFKVPRPASSAIMNTRFPKFSYWRDSLRSFLGTTHR